MKVEIAAPKDPYIGIKTQFRPKLIAAVSQLKRAKIKVFFSREIPTAVTCKVDWRTTPKERIDKGNAEDKYSGGIIKLITSPEKSATKPPTIVIKNTSSNKT